MAGKKKVDVVATGGTVKYEKTYRIPGTDSARFKCDEETAQRLRKDGVVRYADELAREEEASEQQVEEQLPEVNLELLKQDYPELVALIEEHARDGYIVNAAHEKVVEALNGEIERLKQHLAEAGKK